MVSWRYTNDNDYPDTYMSENVRGLKSDTILVKSKDGILSLATVVESKTNRTTTRSWFTEEGELLEEPEKWMEIPM